MTPSKLPSGQFRAQVFDIRTGKNVSAAKVLGLPPTSFKTKKEADAIREKARLKLRQMFSLGPTVLEFWETWTTDPLYARPKESTNIHRRERTERFAKAHADIPIRDIGDKHIAAWLAGGKNVSTVPALRTMFADAGSLKAGRLIDRNPFAGLGVEKKRHSRAGQQPPTIEQARAMVAAAVRLTPPSFAGWLQCAQWTGMRPGELDGLRWEDVDLEGGWINVRQQYNAKSKNFTLPKNGQERRVPIHEGARDAIEAQQRINEFVFLNLQHRHWTPVGRIYHWKVVRAAAGWDKTLYLATRHFYGWFAYEVLRLDDSDVAFALGHTDGGVLVRGIYGHREEDRGLERVREAFREGQSS